MYQQQQQRTRRRAIPERIDVDLMPDRHRSIHRPGHVMSLSAARCDPPDPVQVRIPPDADPSGQRAMLVTSIRVFGRHHPAGR